MTAYQASQVAVGTSATLVLSGLEGRYQVIVELPSDFSGEQVWLGDSGVTSGNGFLLEYGGTTSAPEGSLARVTMDVLLDSTDELYAVASVVNTTVSVMANPR